MQTCHFVPHDRFCDYTCQNQLLSTISLQVMFKTQHFDLKVQGKILVPI